VIKLKQLAMKMIYQFVHNLASHNTLQMMNMQLFLNVRHTKNKTAHVIKGMPAIKLRLHNNNYHETTKIVFVNSCKNYKSSAPYSHIIKSCILSLICHYLHNTTINKTSKIAKYKLHKIEMYLMSIVSIGT
jgi:hypothetical protein